MGKQLEREVEYYYDTHPTREDLMGETAIHAYLVRYLVLVLQWLFHGQICAIYDNLNFYQTRNPKEYPLAPDIAVIKGVPFQYVRSWKVGRTGPAPQVVIEIASEETWKKDRQEKPARYASMGVEEYFVYDPHDPPSWRDIPRRLVGWQLDRATQAMRELSPDEQERLWSVQLDSWLVPDQMYLRLFDRYHHLRLTGEEAQAQARQVEAKRAQALEEKLRSLGVNPDEMA
jgi:Uma2 family endonuclease